MREGAVPSSWSCPRSWRCRLPLPRAPLPFPLRQEARPWCEVMPAAGEHQERNEALGARAEGLASPGAPPAPSARGLQVFGCPAPLGKGLVQRLGTRRASASEEPPLASRHELGAWRLFDSRRVYGARLAANYRSQHAPSWLLGSGRSRELWDS